MKRSDLLIIDKEKIKSDDYVAFSIVISYLIMIFYSRLVALMIIIVIPHCTLFLYGIYMVIREIFLKKGVIINRILFIILGIFYSLFALFILYIIFSKPNINNSHVIAVIAFISIIVGFAGIIKGYIYKSYLMKYRALNFIVGLLTLIFSILSVVNSTEFYIGHLGFYLLIYIANLGARCSLYLSKYQISIFLLRKKQIFRFLINLISESPIL